jgi:hypothetical protein
MGEAVTFGGVTSGQKLLKAKFKQTLSNPQLPSISFTPTKQIPRGGEDLGTHRWVNTAEQVELQKDMVCVWPGQALQQSLTSREAYGRPAHWGVGGHLPRVGRTAQTPRGVGGDRLRGSERRRASRTKTGGEK